MIEPCKDVSRNLYFLLLLVPEMTNIICLRISDPPYNFGGDGWAWCLEPMKIRGTGGRDLAPKGGESGRCRDGEERGQIPLDIGYWKCESIASFRGDKSLTKNSNTPLVIQTATVEDPAKKKTGGQTRTRMWAMGTPNSQPTVRLDSSVLAQSSIQCPATDTRWSRPMASASVTEPESTWDAHR